jgi:CHAD domain-containing protein
MEGDQIKKIIKDRLNSIKKHSKKIGDDFDENAIHAFRVEVKTLRSFLRLVRLHLDEPKLKLSKSFKRLYHIAGAIRDAQLEIEQLKDNQAAMPRYMGKLRHLLLMQKKEWASQFSPGIIRKLEEKLTSIPFVSMDTGALTEFFETRITVIGNLARNEKPTDLQVHSIRKQVKDILLTSKLAKKNWKAAKEQAGIFNLKQLDIIADVIGDYNDKRNTLERLRSFHSRTIEENEVKTIMTICEADEKNLEAEKKNIVLMAREIGLQNMQNSQNTKQDAALNE